MSINKEGVVGNETFLSEVRATPFEPVRRLGAFFVRQYIASLKTNFGVLRALRIGCRLERKAEVKFTELNDAMREYHEVFGHELPPLP